jgi:hypothetical protein
MAQNQSSGVFISKELSEYLDTLESDNKIKKWIDDMENILKENKLAGQSIPKKQIPKRYIDRYGVNNLFRYQHPEGYRSCYTLLNIEGVGVCPIILDIMTHKEYNIVFGYK